MKQWIGLLRNLLLIGVLVAAGVSAPRPAHAAGCQEFTDTSGVLTLFYGCWYCESGDCWTLTCSDYVTGDCD